MKMNNYTITDTFMVDGKEIEITAWLTEYTCEHDGDNLPLHTHDGSLNDRGHITRPVKGTLEVFYRDAPSKFAYPGDPPFLFKPGKEHGLRGYYGTIFQSLKMSARVV